MLTKIDVTIYDHIKEKMSYEEYCANHMNGEGPVEWDHKNFDNIKSLLREEYDFIKNPVEIEEGVMLCKYCSSKRTYSYQKQVRRADEGFTIFVSCFECNRQYREN